MQDGTGLCRRYAEDLELSDRALECDPHAKEVLVALASTVDRPGLFREAKSPPVVGVNRVRDIVYGDDRIIQKYPFSSP